MGPDQPEQDLGICLMGMVSLWSCNPYLQPVIPDGNASIGIMVNITRKQRPYSYVRSLTKCHTMLVLLRTKTVLTMHSSSFSVAIFGKVNVMRT